MIQFFRRIRKKLLSENKFTKYSIYAIGEILLVMIGILLAFQVNKWNDKSKTRVLEQDLLIEVQNSLRKDLNDVNENIKSNKRRDLSRQIIIDWIESNDEYNDTLSTHLRESLTSTYFAAYQGPYETLKQIGMRNISNDSLRNQISKLYNITYPHYLRFDANQEMMFKEHLIPKSIKYLDELNYIKPMVINEISKLRADKEYLSTFKTFKHFGEILLYVGMIPTKNEIEMTLKMIENELNK